MNAVKQYFHVVQLIILYKVVRTFMSADENLMRVYNYAAQGGSNFKSVDENLVCDHSNESY